MLIALWLIFLIIIFYFLFQRFQNKKKQYLDDITQLKSTLNTLSSIKSSIFFWLDSNKLWVNDDLLHKAKEDILKNLKDKQFRVKIRETFWLSLYNIILWLVANEDVNNFQWISEENIQLLNEITIEEEAFFKNDELNSYQILNKNIKL